MKRSFTSYISLFLLVFTGCGGGKVPLSGTVTFSDDGSPLTVGYVCFETDTYLSRGMLSSKGTYNTGSISEKDGIPPGTYRVYISGAMRAIGVDKSGEPVYESLIDERFGNGATSGLTVTIPTPNRKFDFRVDRAAASKGRR